ncbi:RNA methyltransferase [Acidiferrimicrobium sp. IK]|nr:RNA methyltransferase [Acidiferrimicrobium sp. IK]MCU4184779.1 RNA methyltransferase [Acidiferrimicrobium sp. IK]
MVEGTKVLGEALAAGARVESVYVDRSAGPEEEAVVARAADAGSRVFDLAPGVLERVAGTVTPQALLAVVATVDVPLEQIDVAGPALVVVCADVRDPGNAGTVLRSAEASGAAAVVFCEGSVDLYNPKTVRASAGAVFHVPVVAGPSPADALDALGGLGLRRLGTVARDGVAYTDTDLRGPTALVLGNEATGLPPSVEGHLDGLVTIPMAGRSESLNVGMAAAVLCFEAARQRRAPAALTHA